MIKNPLFPKLRINKRFFLSSIVFLCFLSPYLRADDLDRAAALEAAGDKEAAGDLYEKWLEQRENRSDPGYGRTLLHLLRSGGSPGALLNLLEKYLPHVNNPYDRMEAVRFGAYLADLSGRMELAKEYFSLLREEDPQYDWINSYIALQENQKISLADPLVSTGSLVDEEHAKNRMILYLIFLSRMDKPFKNWIIKGERVFPFLTSYPDWTYQVWSVCTDKALHKTAGEYKNRLLRDFPESPEAGMVKSKVVPYGNPVLLLPVDLDEAGQTAAETPTEEYLQIGSFGDQDNAESFKIELERSTGLSVVVVPIDGMFKVLCPTFSAAEEIRILKQKGYDSFKVPPPAHSR